MSPLFVDTSAWFSFFVAKEKKHSFYKKLLLEEHHHLCTSMAIFSELFTLLVSRHHEDVAYLFGEKLKAGELGLLYRVTDADDAEAWDFLKQNRGRGLSYADATTIALMKRIKINRIATLDSDFVGFGLEVLS